VVADEGRGDGDGFGGQWGGLVKCGTVLFG
jgi:hypothetical protein